MLDNMCIRIISGSSTSALESFDVADLAGKPAANAAITSADTIVERMRMLGATSVPEAMQQDTGRARICCRPFQVPFQQHLVARGADIMLHIPGIVGH